MPKIECLDAMSAGKVIPGVIGLSSSNAVTRDSNGRAQDQFFHFTAIRTEWGNFKVIYWRVDDHGIIGRAESADINVPFETVGDIAVIPGGPPAAPPFLVAQRDAVVAVRVGTDLKVRAFPGGPLGPTTHESAGAAKGISIDQRFNGDLVTALENGSGHLELLTWTFPPGAKSIVRGTGKSDAPIVGPTRVLWMDNSTALTIATKKSPQRLWLRQWKISDDRAHIALGVETTDNGIMVKRATGARLEATGEVVTAAVDSDDHLRLGHWRALGSAIRSLGTNTLPVVKDVGITGVPRLGESATTFATAAVSAAGVLQVSYFDAAISLTPLAIETHGLSGTILEAVIASGRVIKGGLLLLTPVIRSDGHLQMITWRLQP
jgi:hypothetical protein